MKKEKETLFSIQNEEQLDNLKKPRISFYSSKKIIQSLLALPEVKKDLKSLVKAERKVEVERQDNWFNLKVYNKNREIEPENDGKGIKMLEKGLHELNYKNEFIHDYGWTWIPPAVGAFGGLMIGSAIGYYGGVFSNQTYAQIQQSSIVTGLEGAGIGGVAGAIGDAAVVCKDVVKTYVGAPLKRIKLADKVQKEVRDQ